MQKGRTMPEASAAKLVLDAIGGRRNVVAADVCMTRLRLTLTEPSMADLDAISQIKGVLGVVRRGEQGLEVVFVPAVINGVYEDFIALTKGVDTVVDPGERPAGTMRVVISPARHRSYRAQAEALAARAMAEEGTGLPAPVGVTGPASSSVHTPVPESSPTDLGSILADMDEDEMLAPGPRLLIINGPNINMLGVREPEVYGTADYPALIELCRRGAAEAGFSEVRCFQSNHEGEIVDEIQHALGAYDAILINPAAYTHTSVAILDAIKAVRIPTIEVHISDVDSREGFRKVSYVREACIGCVSGLGIEGYRKAIFDLASYLAEN